MSRGKLNITTESSTGLTLRIISVSLSEPWMPVSRMLIRDSAVCGVAFGVMLNSSEGSGLGIPEPRGPLGIGVGVASPLWSPTKIFELASYAV